MTALNLTPAPGAAPATRRVLAHARTETLNILRNGEQALLAIVIPVGLLLAGRFAGERFGVDVQALAPSILALALFSTSFTSLAISTAFERRQGVLERLAATPLGRNGLLAGKALTVLAVCLLQLLILVPVALALGWRPQPSPLQTLVVALVAIGCCWTFANLALLMAGTLRAETVLGLANTLYVIFAAVGAVLVPVATYPAATQLVVAALPTAALGEALRGWSAGTATPWALLVPLVWAPLSSAVARKAFRWMS